MNVGDLTESQLKILVYLGEIASSSHRPPTVREIAADVFGSEWAQAAYFHLGKLREKGYLIWSSRAKRDLRLTPAGERILREIAGATDAPPLSVPDEDAYRFVRQAYPKATHGLFRVPDDSMDGLGILEGDWIVVHRQDNAEKGDVVVVCFLDPGTLEPAETLRRFLPESDEAALFLPMSRNPEHRSLCLTVEHAWRIVGKYVALCRENPSHGQARECAASSNARKPPSGRAKPSALDLGQVR